MAEQKSAMLLSCGIVIQGELVHYREEETCSWKALDCCAPSASPAHDA